MKSIGFSKAKASVAKAGLRVFTALFVYGGGPVGETDEHDEGKVHPWHSKSHTEQTEPAGPAVHVEVQCSPDAHQRPDRSTFATSSPAPPPPPLAPPPPPPPVLTPWPTGTYPYQEQPTFLSRREGRISVQDQAASGLTVMLAAPAHADLAQSMPSPCLPSPDQTVASRMIPEQTGQGKAAPAQAATPQAPTPAPSAAPAQPARACRMPLPAASAWTTLLLSAIPSGCVAGVLFLQVSGAASMVPAPLTPLAMLTPDASNGTCPLLQPASSFSHHLPLPPVAAMRLGPDAAVIPTVLPISPGNTSLGTCPAIFQPRVASPASYVQRQWAHTPSSSRLIPPSPGCPKCHCQCRCQYQPAAEGPVRYHDPPGGPQLAARPTPLLPPTG